MGMSFLNKPKTNTTVTSAVGEPPSGGQHVTWERIGHCSVPCGQTPSVGLEDDRLLFPCLLMKVDMRSDRQGGQDIFFFNQTQTTSVREKTKCSVASAC